MRRLVLFLAVMALVAVTAPATVAAAAPTAADFAADCNADGIVRVTGKQRYVGGSGVLNRDCVVGLSVGAKLVFRRVVLTGGSGLAAISSPADTTVKVIDSTIDMAGPLELTAGCCAGDAGVPEQNGKVVVRRSSLTGSSVQLMSSFAWPSGKVVVTRSTIEARGPQGIQIRASDFGGSSGVIKVKASSLISASDVLIRTGSSGRTRVKRVTSSISGAATVTTGTGGTCRSFANTPRLPCS
jgi:hypothetical protein